MKKYHQGPICRRKKIFMLLVWASVLAGCTALPDRKPTEESAAAKESEVRAYSRFIEQNMEMLDDVYSPLYRPYLFLVDTRQGAVPIQDLIEPAVAAPVLERLPFGNTADADLLRLIFEHVQSEYDYVVDARYWPTIEETLTNKEADCKGLSLLLLSLFLAAGYDAYAAISNGHMWVRGSDGLRWHTFEIDTDPIRNQIYKIEGFYQNPMFIVFRDQTFKRKRK